MNSRSARLFAKLTIASALSLALPASALAAATPVSVSGPSSVGEAGGKATYTINCGNGFLITDVPATGPVNYTTSGATEDADYKKTAGSVNCSAIQPTHTVEVEIINDTAIEGDENFKFSVASGDGFVGPGGTGEVTTTIVDNDAPTVTVGVARVSEGDSGTSNADVPVTLSQSSAVPITLSYSTQDNSATAGSDYTATSGDLTIPAGETSGKITIPIIGDTVTEQAEGFFVNVGSAQGVVVIFDNDVAPLPQFALTNNPRVTEGDAGTVNALFTVTLSRQASEQVQVAWKTANWTATLADYAGGQGILKFAPGETEKTISINVKGDLRVEPTEMFAVILEGPVGGTLAQGKDKALGIIDDDDRVGPKVDIESALANGRKVTAFVACPAEAVTGCKGTLEAKRGSLKFGKGEFDIPKGATGEVTLSKMSKKAYRKLRKRARKAKFIAIATDGDSNPMKVKEKLKLNRV